MGKSFNFPQGPKQPNGERIMVLTNGAAMTGHLCGKKFTCPPSHTIHKDVFEMDRKNCKSENYEAFIYFF